MNRLAVLTGLSGLILLTACAKPDDQVIVEACVAENASEAYCQCVVDAMEENVSESVVSKIATAIREDGKSQSEAEDALTLAEKAELLQLFPHTISCAAQQ